MLDVPSTPLQRLLRERRPGHNLEAPFYLSPDIFAADMDIIFGRHWIYVGVEPDIPEPGDVLTVDVGKDSVAIIRDDDGDIRAFHNVCRHRGSRLVHDEKSTVGNLVCRYHSWTYDLTGALVHAEHMGPDFKPKCHGLKPVHVRSLEGLVFICLADTPPSDFGDMAARLGPYIAPHNIRDTKVAFQKDIVEPGNWKLTMENNRECYHCNANHPELTVPLFAYGFGFAPEEMDEFDRANAERYGCLLKTRHVEWEAEGLPSREIDELDTMVTAFRVERLPLDGDGESHTLDTRAACRKLLGTFTNAKLGGLSVLDPTELLAPFPRRSYRDLLGLAGRCRTFAFAHEMARPQGCRRGHRLRSGEPDQRLARHQRPGFGTCRLLPERRAQPGL